MDLIDDTEMRRTEHEAAVSSSDHCKIVAETPDESYVVFRTSTGVRISSQLDNGGGSNSEAMPVKDEVTGDGSVTLCDGLSNDDVVESEPASLEFRVKEEPNLDLGEEMVIDDSIAQSAVSRDSFNDCVTVDVKQEPDSLSIIPTALILAPTPLQVIRPKPQVIDVESDSLKQEMREETKVGALSLSLQVKEEKPVYVKKVNTQGKVRVEDGDFPVEKDWYLVGRSLVTATSTSKGRRLEDNEVVNFAFPSTVNWKVPNIVRFSTKRCGEVIPLHLLILVFLILQI